MMICQMAGCLKVCKTCENKKKCDASGVCCGIDERPSGLYCSSYKRKRKQRVRRKAMNLLEIENDVEIQSEYEIVYYDREKNQRFKLEKCIFTKSIKIDYIYIENGTIFFEINEWHLMYNHENRNIEFLNPTKI